MGQATTPAEIIERDCRHEIDNLRRREVLRILDVPAEVVAHEMPESLVENVVRIPKFLVRKSVANGSNHQARHSPAVTGSEQLAQRDLAIGEIGPAAHDGFQLRS